MNSDRPTFEFLYDALAIAELLAADCPFQAKETEQNEAGQIDSRTNTQRFPQCDLE